MVGSSAHWYQAATTTGLNPCKNVGFESPIVAAVNHFATMYRRHRDGTESGYLTGEGLTLAANSAVKIPVVSGMPDGIEVYMDFTLPASLYGDGLSNKGFILLAKGTANVLAFGSEQYSYAWPSIYGIAEGKTAEADCAWRWATDAGGTSLGNTYMWWGDQSLHQHLRLRLKIGRASCRERV